MPTDVITMSPEERWSAVLDNTRRMIRTGAQFVLGAAFGVSDIGPTNALDFDWRLIVGSFLGGCVTWLVTTLAAPPKG